jgi:hypothetical protein
MSKSSAFAFYVISGIMVLTTIFYLMATMSIAYATENIMELQDALFAFGWSANAGDQWLVNGEIIILNSKALVLPPSAPIEGDAGLAQTNPYAIYLNNIQFTHGWSSNVSDRYRPSPSMIVGAGQAFNTRGLVEPSHTPIYEDAGPAQTNPSQIYLNNIGFHIGWSQTITDRYRPSDSMIVGSQSAFNSKAFIVPPTTPISEDAGPSQLNPSFIYFNNIGFSYTWSPHLGDKYRPSTSMIVGSLSSFNSKAFIEPSIPSEAEPIQQNLALIYLNNIGFHFAWSPNPDDRYSPSTTMDVGPLTPLNPQALKVPPSWAIGIDTTPPLIDVPTREPSGDVMPDQPVKVLVAVTDTESSVKNVTLSYTVNNGTSWFDIPMVYNETTSKYEATIPGQPINTLVRFKITAYDNYENNATRDGTEPYFTYKVIPEFPSPTLLIFLSCASLTALIFYKNKTPTKKK